MAQLTTISALRHAGNTLLSLLFPNKCLVCNEGPHDSVDPICDNCFSKFTNLPIENRVSDVTVNESIDAVYSGWAFNDYLRDTIHALKYEDRARIGTYLGKRLGGVLKPKLMGELDEIVPVPLHHVKYRDRGYNQAYWIGKGLAQELEIPLNQNLVKRIKHTVSQTTLDREERQRNMNRAFKIMKDVQNKKIGIVDDVLTTGSTISSMATLLKQRGAQSIIALTIATPLEKKYDTYAESV